MVASMAASARSLLAKLEEEAEKTFVLLVEAVKESQTPVAGDLEALQVSLEHMSVALRRLSFLLHRLENPERELPPPSGPYDLSRLSACQDALSGLARALRPRTSSSINRDQVAGAHWVVQSTLTTLQLALDLSRYSLVLGVLSGTPQVPPARRPSTTKFSAFITVRIPEQSRAGHRILDALCSADHSTARALDLLDAKCPGTTDWVLTDHDGVKDWIQGTHQLLHLMGSPGCGKSVIAATIVNYLAQKATSPTWSLCYFFIDPRVPCNPTIILGTLLAQIMAQSLQAYSAAEALFALPEEKVDGTTTALQSRHSTPDGETVRWVNYKDPNVLAEILRAAMQSFSKNHVVIDGINHLPSDHQTELLRLLCTLDWERTKILIMSRPVESETFRIQDWVGQKWEYNCCSISASSDDLRIFVKRTTDQLAHQQPSGQALRQPLLPEFLEATANAVAESKNFQYAQYQLWYLQIQDPTESQPPRNLPLPQGNSWALTYTEMINAIVERESNRKGQYVKSSESDIFRLRSVIENALSWLLLSTNTGPGHFKEFSFSKRCFFEALSLALTPDAESLHELEPAADLEVRFSFYFEALMVERTATVPLGLAGLGTSKISPPVTQYSYRHWSFMEYLMTLGHGSVPNVNLERASTSLALACLRYVGFAEFKQTMGGIKLLQQRAYERQIHNPFYSLAAGWLPEMLKRADWTNLRSRLLILFDATEKDSSIPFFLEYFNYHFPWVYELTSLSHTPKALIQLVDELTAGRLTAFHIAVSLGLPDVCRGITETWSEPDKLALFRTNTAYGPPLALAILGPRAFAISESETWQDFYVPLRQEKTAVSSIDVRGTIFYLLEHGNSCSTEFPSRAGGGTLSLAASALMRCAFLNDADLFIHLMKAELQPPISLDSTFIQVLDDIFFPDLGSHATPVVLYNTLARHQRRALSSDAWVFLDKICEYIMDRHIDLVLEPPPETRGGAEEEDLDLLLTTAWNCAFKYELACAKLPRERGDPKVTLRPINCSDSMYSKLRESSLREFKPYQTLRLMQDPRWDVNQPLENRGSETRDENAGQTALHVTVENQGEVACMLAKALIRSGANVLARDARGRTPLHVAESESMLKLLLGHGAESGAQDLDGRTVWHVAAANNDARTLRDLAKWHRPKMDMLAEALRCVTKQGRTPLAEAVAYFHERSRWVNVKSPELVEPEAAEVLLPLCKGDPLTFRSDIPLVHLAAEWGRESLLVDLDEAGAIERNALAAGNLTAFHFLNVGASQSFIRKLSRAYGAELVVVPSSSGDSVVEKFMSRVADLAPPPSSNAPNPRPPAAEQPVDPKVFQMLLLPSVVRSKDKEGRTFWERFCYNVIAAYCRKFREGQSVAVDAICRISEAGGMSDAIKFYEEETKATAFVPLVRAVWTTSKYIPSWFSVPCLAVLLNAASLGEAGMDENVVFTLKWAISNGKSRLVELLLERGAIVHAPAKGHSVLEEFHKYDVAMFQIVLKHADKDKLNTLNKHGRAPIHNLICESEASDRRGGGAASRSAKITALVNAGANVDRLTDDRMSPVILAAMKSNQESAKALLDLGADTSIRLPDGLDISLAAASRGCVLILRKLMSLGFPAQDWLRRFSITVSLAKEAWKKRIYQGCHALHIAALNCQVGSLRFYLEKDLIPVGDPCFDHKMTALHFAAIGGASDAIRYLVAQGADINAPDVTGLTPLHVGVQARHPDSVRTLLSLGANRALRDREGRTPLLLAIQWNVQLCFNLLKEDALRPKTDADSNQSTEGQSGSSASAVLPAVRTARATRYMAEALENSVMMGDQHAVQFVVQNGCPADATMPSCGECSALGLAVWAAKPHLVKLLLDNGARRITSRCQKHSFLKVSALFEAAVLRPQAPHCLALILDVALRDGTNWLNSHFTPLHIAVQQSNLASVIIVLKHIAANAAAYRKWLTVSLSGPSQAVAVASSAARPAARVNPVVREIVNRQVKLLFADDEYHMEPTTALHMAIMSDSVDIARALVKQGGADVDGVDWELSTPLHRAVNNGFRAGVEFLVKAGASTNKRDRDGNTPLMRAARAGRVDLCRLLIEGGADTTVRDLDGMTLLSCCAEKSSSPALFQYLSSPEVGLDPYARDKTTYSPLHDAVLNSSMTSYVFSGRWDFERVACGVDLIKSFFALVVDDGDGRFILPRLHRRWPRAEWSRYVNACPPRYLSPLCLAAARGLLWELSWLLQPGGADPEQEGSAEGTALMTACSHGRIEAVKILVRSGARVAYVKRPPGEGGGGDGPPVIQNALEYAREFPEIVRWLLVGRYTDQGKIPDRPHDASAAAAAELRGCARPAEGAEGAPEIGRVLQVRYVLTGTNREYGRLQKESMLAYLLRVAEIRLSLRGTVIVPFEDPSRESSP